MKGQGSFLPFLFTSSNTSCNCQLTSCPGFGKLSVISQLNFLCLYSMSYNLLLYQKFVFVLVHPMVVACFVNKIFLLECSNSPTYLHNIKPFPVVIYSESKVYELRFFFSWLNKSLVAMIFIWFFISTSKYDG